MNDTQIAAVRLGFAAQNPMALFGAELGAIEPGSVTLSMPVREEMTTAGTGIVMGGLVATLADVAAGLSIATLMAPPRPVMTVDFTSHQLAPARGDRIEAVGRVEKIGRSLCITGADVFAVAGETRTKVARLVATFAVMG